MVLAHAVDIGCTHFKQSVTHLQMVKVCYSLFGLLSRYDILASYFFTPDHLLSV